MIAADLLEVLCCPVTRQQLALADGALLHLLNAQIEQPESCLCNLAGERVTAPLEAALLRADGAVIYPIRDGIPVLLADEAIPVK